MLREVDDSAFRRNRGAGRCERLHLRQEFREPRNELLLVEARCHEGVGVLLERLPEATEDGAFGFAGEAVDRAADPAVLLPEREGRVALLLGWLGSEFRDAGAEAGVGFASRGSFGSAGVGFRVPHRFPKAVPGRVTGAPEVLPEAVALLAGDGRRLLPLAHQVANRVPHGLGVGLVEQRLRPPDQILADRDVGGELLVALLPERLEFGEIPVVCGTEPLPEPLRALAHALGALAPRGHQRADLGGPPAVGALGDLLRLFDERAEPVQLFAEFALGGLPQGADPFKDRFPDLAPLFPEFLTPIASGVAGLVPGAFERGEFAVHALEVLDLGERPRPANELRLFFQVGPVTPFADFPGLPQPRHERRLEALETGLPFRPHPAPDRRVVSQRSEFAKGGLPRFERKRIRRFERGEALFQGGDPFLSRADPVLARRLGGIQHGFGVPGGVSESLGVGTVGWLQAVEAAPDARELPAGLGNLGTGGALAEGLGQGNRMIRQFGDLELPDAGLLPLERPFLRGFGSGA